MATYQLKLSIIGIKPLIWRRVLTPSNILLSSLHEVVQILMRWEDYHLHEFICGDMHLGIPFVNEFDEELLTIDYSNVCLDMLMTKKKDKLSYIYDFGDFWEVDIVLEDIIPDSKIKNPQLLTGERAAPPEDCGGIYGFADMLRILNDPKDPEYDEMVVWSKSFDPEAIDKNDLQALLDCWRFEYMRPKTEKQIKAEEDRIKHIRELIIEFCDKKLNNQYKKVCVELFEDLFDFTEILTGRTKAEVWACAIVQAVGNVNLLYDSSSTLYLIKDQQYEWFGVKKSTVSNKVTQINEVLMLTQFFNSYIISNEKEKETFISIDGESLEWMKKQYRQDN